jgi:hypothetical protein
MGINESVQIKATIIHVPYTSDVRNGSHLFLIPTSSLMNIPSKRREEKGLLPFLPHTHTHTYVFLHTRSDKDEEREGKKEVSV